MHCLDEVVRPKRFYLRLQEGGYHGEFIVEERAYAWNPVSMPHAGDWHAARPRVRPLRLTRTLSSTLIT